MVRLNIHRRNTPCKRRRRMDSSKGFAGINEEHGQLVCRPNLPEKWNGMNFKLIYKGKWYSVEIKDDKGTISMI